MKHLYALPYSPWSEKAKWALEHHAHEFKYHEYVPMLGEPLLRAKTKNFRERLTIPLLIDGSDVVMDSFAIAKHVDKTGQSETLFPAVLKDQIDHFNQISELAIESGRMRVVKRILQNPRAQQDSLPSFIPQKIRKPLTPIAKIGAMFIEKKYRHEQSDLEHLLNALEALRKTLEQNGNYVLGTFSFADIAMSATLQFVEPVDNSYIPLGEHEWHCWRDQELAKNYGDLVQWRDQLYAKTRPKISQTVF